MRERTADVLRGLALAGIVGASAAFLFLPEERGPAPGPYDVAACQTAWPGGTPALARCLQSRGVTAADVHDCRMIVERDVPGFTHGNNDYGPNCVPCRHAYTAAEKEVCRD